MKSFFRAVALAACLSLLTACGSYGLWKYPKEQILEQDNAIQLVTVALPPDADEVMLDTMEMLAAKAKELSDGHLIIKYAKDKDVLELYQQGSVDAALLWDTDIAKLNGRLTGLTAPFLFQDEEKLFTVLSNPNGIAGSAAQKQLKGTVLAIYYGGTMGIATRSNQYLAEVGLEGISSLGADKSLLNNSIFEALGTKKIQFLLPEEMKELMEGQELRGMEVPLSGNFPAEAKYLEVTRHRIRTLWLMCSQDAQLSSQHLSLLQEAVAYTIQSQNDSRNAAEESFLEQLEGSGVSVVRQDYSKALFTQAVKLYRDEYEENGISREVWTAIRSIVE